MDVKALLRLRVVPVEIPPGLEGIGAGGGALGVDGGVNQIGVPRLPGRLKDLGKHIGVELGVGGDFGGGQQHVVELLGGEIKAVGQLPVLHGDGEGEYLDIQFLPQGGGDIGGGIGGKFDTGHRGPPQQKGRFARK